MRYNNDVKCLFLYNPQSGKGITNKKLALVERMLKSKYDEVEFYATKSAEDMEEKARAAAETCDALVFAGGDGSFNTVLQGLGEKRIPLGYIPTGTTNDAAHSLGIPRRVKGALKVILHGHTAPVDCMRINGERYAIYIACAGSLASVTYETPQKSKRRLGWFAYAFSVLKKMSTFETFPFRVTCGDEVMESNGALVFIMNGKWIARFPVNKKSSMQDGTLEVAVIKEAPKPGFFRKLAAFCRLGLFMLFGCRLRMKNLVLLRGSNMKVEVGDGVIWDYDGEKGSGGSIEVETLRGHVNLFVNRHKKI